MPGPCANCCRSREPCLGDCDATCAPTPERIYEVDIEIRLSVAIRVRARGAQEALELVKQRGMRQLAREAWVRGEHQLLTGHVKVPFPPGSRPRPRH